MALLWPGIRKEHEDLLQRRRRQLLLQYLHRVVADDAHVAQRRRLQRQQQPADAGAVDLDTQKVALRVRGREPQQVVAVAEADLRAQRRQLPKSAAGSSGAAANSTPYFGHSSASARCCAGVMRPGARNEGANRARMFDLGHNLPGKLRRGPGVGSYRRWLRSSVPRTMLIMV